MGWREFVCMIGLLQALQSFAIDSMLPALGIIAHDLGGASHNNRQWIIAVYPMSAGLGALFPGAMADRFGRRPVLLWTLGAYTLTATACALATSFPAMIGLRVVAGLTSSSLSVLPAAMIRDRATGNTMARMQSVMMMIFMAVPVLAPVVGQGLLWLGSWRLNFALMAVLGLAMALWAALRLDESLAPHDRQPVALDAIYRNMQAVLRNRTSLTFIAVQSIILGALFGYVNSSQQLIVEAYGVRTGYTALLAAMILAMGCGTFINARIVERTGARRTCRAGLVGYAAFSAMLVMAVQAGAPPLWLISAGVAAAFFCQGFVTGNAAALAILPFGRAAASASSVLSFARIIVSATLGAAIGQAYDGTARPLAWAMLGGSLVSLGLVVAFGGRDRD